VGGLDIRTALDWRGHSVVDRGGEEIGTLKEIYLDQSERPTWGSVHTALFGLRQTLVPLTEAQLDGDRLRLPYEGDHVQGAPTIDPDVQLTPDEEERLYRHYGMGSEQAEAAEEPGAVTGGTSREPGAVAATAASSDTRAEPEPELHGERSAPSSPQEPAADDAMTRSEEEVRIGKRTRERGRARLKKYVVTDYVETKVPVKREEVRLEHEPPREEDQD
jgi:hypothetical protein